MPSYIRKPIITHDEEKRQQPKVILLFGSHHIIVLPSTLTTTTGLMLVLLAAYSIEPSTTTVWKTAEGMFNIKNCSDVLVGCICRVWLWYSKFFFATFFNYIDRYNYTQFDLKKKNYILFKTDIGFIKSQSTPLFKDLKEYVMENKSDQTKCCLLTDCEVKSQQFCNGFWNRIWPKRLS